MSLITPETEVLVGAVIDKAVLVIFGDKITAEKQREINRTIQQALDGSLTDEQAYQALRFKDGDALDQLLPGSPSTNALDGA